MHMRLRAQTRRQQSLRILKWLKIIFRQKHLESSQVTGYKLRASRAVHKIRSKSGETVTQHKGINDCFKEYHVVQRIWDWFSHLNLPKLSNATLDDLLNHHSRDFGCYKIIPQWQGRWPRWFWHWTAQKIFWEGGSPPFEDVHPFIWDWEIPLHTTKPTLLESIVWGPPLSLSACAHTLC